MWLSTFKEIFMLSLFALVKAQNHCSPPLLENAELISTPAPKQQYNTNDVVYYKCKFGYHFKGSSATKHKTRCTENGNFSPAPLKCYDLCDNRCQNDAFCNQGRCSCDQNHIGVSCEMRICKLPSVLHGTVKQVNPLNVDGKPGWVREGASIFIKCDKGFSIKRGKKFSRCHRGLGWDYGTLPVCQPDICEHSDISHGTAKPYRDVYAVGQTVTFSCNQGYEILHGDHQLSCGIGGVWSGTWPSCLPKKCPSIHLHNGMIDPPNARLTTGEYPVGSKLSLNCISGFYYRGISSKIVCVGPPTVEWSSEPGVCILLSEFNDECQTEGKIMKVDGNGDASCVFETTVVPTKSSLKKTEKPLTIVTSTAGGLLLLLLLVIAIVACQRRRIARLQREHSGRHRLNTDDDRLSFVYYSNDVHVVLPSYDEAMQARRINNPPPYAPDEVELSTAAANAITRPTGTAPISGGSGGSTPANIYETIDEIRTTVNAVHASLASGTSQPATTAENSQEQAIDTDESVPMVPPRALPAEPTSNDDAPPPPTRFGIYDGPSEEPIYASVQRILSHSLVIAANGGSGGNNNEQAQNGDLSSNNDTKAAGDSESPLYEHATNDEPESDNVSASSFSFDEEVDGDTEPLL